MSMCTIGCRHGPESGSGVTRITTALVRMVALSLLVALIGGLVPRDAMAQDCLGPSLRARSVRVSAGPQYPIERPYSSIPKLGIHAGYRMQAPFLIVGNVAIPLDGAEGGLELGAAYEAGRAGAFAICPLVTLGYESRHGHATLGMALGRRLGSGDAWKASYFVDPALMLRSDGIRPFADAGATLPVFGSFHATLRVRRALLDGGGGTVAVEIGTFLH